MDRLFLGLSVSFIFGFARYRFPTVPKWLASSGLAVGIGLLLWSFMPFVRTGPALLTFAALVALAIAFEWQSAAGPIEPPQVPDTAASNAPLPASSP